MLKRPMINRSRHRDSHKKEVGWTLENTREVERVPTRANKNIHDVKEFTVGGEGGGYFTIVGM